MGGTAQNWNTVNIPRGKRVELWGGLAVPGAGGRMTIDSATLTPDAVANPTAVHLGRTVDGAELHYKTTLQNRTSDEFDSPFDTMIEMTDAYIVAQVMATLDTSIMSLLMPGVTKATGSGYEELAFGGSVSIPSKSSFAAIFHMPEDDTKVGVFHLYSALNEQEVAMRIRKGANAVGSTPIALHGFSLAGRAAGDQVGKFWKQV